MTSTILLAYATTDGHTLRICQRLQQRLSTIGQNALVHPIDAVDAVLLARSEKIVIGASIRYGKHSPGVNRFIETHRGLLESRPSAFFSVNLVARKPDKNQPETNPYARRFLAKISWKPRLAAVFAGRLDYPRYKPLDRFVIRLIMAITGGPTDPAAVVEFTDWDAVDRFADQIAQF